MVRHPWRRAGACIIGLVTAACFVDGGVHRKTAVWKSSPQTRKNSVKFVRQQDKFPAATHRFTGGRSTGAP
eukprot:s12507_g1.t1